MVKGLARLTRQIQALPRLQLQAASDALAQGATELTDAIARSAPHGATGDLGASVGWDWADAYLDAVPMPTKSKARDARARKVALGASKLALFVHAGDAKAFYARWVEFGTAAHPAKGGKPDSQPHHATPPEPFFWPIVRAYKKRVKGRVTRNANKAAKAVAQVS